MNTSTDYSQFSEIQVSRSGAVLQLTFNRPEALNAVNMAMHGELSEIFRLIAKDRDTRAVLLTGSGRAFCAGGDLKDFTDMTGTRLDDLFVEARRIVVDILEMPQPLVVAINGPAYGLGATIALLGDVVYASQTARIADTHVVAGVVAGDGGAIIWPWLIGAARAKEFLMTGDPVSAEDAERMGLISHVMAADELLPEALAMAQRLAAGPRLAIEGTKLSVNQLLRDAANQVLDVSLATEKACFTSEDHREALAAFQE